MDSIERSEGKPPETFNSAIVLSVEMVKSALPGLADFLVAPGVASLFFIIVNVLLQFLHLTCLPMVCEGTAYCSLQCGQFVAILTVADMFSISY